MHEIGGFALGRISATVVASGCRYAFMADHFCTVARSAPVSSNLV
jgi:hypothetical protein